MAQIQAASIAYRIAIGPHAERKALTLYSVPPLEAESTIPLGAQMYGFSLHAGTVCEAHQRSELERLCRYITRPPIATKRLSVDDLGRVVYCYKRPFRDGSSHVVLEPLDFLARLAALQVCACHRTGRTQEPVLHKICGEWRRQSPHRVPFRRQSLTVTWF